MSCQKLTILQESTVTIIARLPAGSIALVKFGLDSFVESLSGIAMVWRLIKHGRISQEEEEKVERKVTIIVAAVSLVIMPILFYIKCQTGRSIYSRSLALDAKKILVCVFLFVALLLGLVLSFSYGFWQAGSIMGFFAAEYRAQENLGL